MRKCAAKGRPRQAQRQFLMQGETQRRRHARRQAWGPKLRAGITASLLVFLPAAAPAQPAATLRLVAVVGDAVPESLTGVPGDATRGRAIVANRQVGLCLLCHTGPFPEERFQGNLAPDLTGTGLRWSEGQLRLRMVDARRLNSATIMPPYYYQTDHRTDGLRRVGADWQSRPILAAQQIEDVVAFLRTLRE